MPVYEYECKACDKVFEIQQKMADGPITNCPECDGPVKKIISTTSFQLKGGGWYSDGYSSGGDGESAKPAACPAAGKCDGCPASTI